MNNKIEIIHYPDSQKPFFIINKPSGLPSAPISIDDENNALSILLKEYPQLSKVKGKKEIEYGLIHRIDTVTEGLLLIAAEQSFYDYVQNEQKQNRFIKTYSAQCNYNLENIKSLEGFPQPEIDISTLKNQSEFSIKSMFRYYGNGNKEVRPVTSECSEKVLKKVGQKKEYSTNVKILDINKDIVYVECKITMGFKHQVRNHLAWIGLPIINDNLYNSECKNCNEQIRFIAKGLEFEYPKGDLNSYVRKDTWT